MNKMKEKRERVPRREFGICQPLMKEEPTSAAGTGTRTI